MPVFYWFGIWIQTYIFCTVYNSFITLSFWKNMGHQQSPFLWFYCLGSSFSCTTPSPHHCWAPSAFYFLFNHNSFSSLSLSSFRNKCEILSHSFWRVNFYFHILSELLWVVIKGKEIICIEIVTSAQAASGAKLEILWSFCAPNHSCRQRKQEPLLCRGSFWISEVYSRMCCE